MHSDKCARCEVLIVGAGPTGLMMACQLVRNGIKFRIIEKNSGPTIESRALAIHARSMEIFSQMGLAEKFIAQGKKAKAINYVVNGRVKNQVSLKEFGKGLTEFPFLLILDQSKTERLLLDYLSHWDITVEWNTELMTFEQNEESVTSTIQYNDKNEIFETNYLIGADGAKSKVRNLLNIPFHGKTYLQTLFVLDCGIDTDLKDDEGYIAFSKHSLAAIFRFPDGRCRIISLVPPELNDKDSITFEDIAKTFASRMQMDIVLSDPKWISIYRSHHRCTTSFRKGRCFLAGDSAHIHSPIGGQGMNTGLQDAYNLAWKLAMTLQGNATDSLLNTYEEERLSTARSLVNTIDKVFGIVTIDSGFFGFMRMHVSPKILTVLKILGIGRFAFKKLSQIGISYNHSLLTEHASIGRIFKKTPQPGDRFPFIQFKDQSNQQVNIQREISGASFHLFLFSVNKEDTRFEAIYNMTKSYLPTVDVSRMQLTRETTKLYSELGMNKGGFFLVRPDMHIAYRGSQVNIAHLDRYLRKIFQPILRIAQ